MAINDPSQLGGWFDAYARALTLYARQWLDAAAAEDVVQEVFLRLAARPPEARSIRAWVYRAVRNEALSHRRSRLRRGRREQTATSLREEWFLPSTDCPIDARSAADALAALPAPQREVIVLRIWSGLTLAECAAVTGESISTLHSRYRTGLSALREKLEPSCPKSSLTIRTPIPMKASPTRPAIPLTSAPKP